MPIFHPDHGPDDRVLVGAFGEERKVFANLETGNVGGDGFELAADFARRIRLQIKHVLVGRTPRQEDHDDGLVRFSDTGRRFRSKQFRQSQATQPEGANFQKIPARDAVAVA
jgi:hypothetical protein